MTYVTIGRNWSTHLYYYNNNKIIVTKDKKIDLLVYTVIYAFWTNQQESAHPCIKIEVLNF